MIIELIDPKKEAGRIVQGLEPDLEAEALRDLVVRTTSREPAVYVAAIDDKRVVGLVAFRRHQLDNANSGHVCAFQAAGVLTSSEYRGRGVFANIVRQSEDFLLTQGGEMIFGFPNANAYPIWTKKLGYGKVPLFRWSAPAIFGLNGLMIRGGDKSISDALFPDDEDMVASKKSLHGGDVVAVAVGGSFAWGIKRFNRIRGLNISVLDIGGIRCRDGDDLKAVLARLVSDVGSVHGVRLVTTGSNPVLPFLRIAKLSPLTHEVVIYKWLKSGSSGTPPLAFYTGMADWF